MGTPKGTIPWNAGTSKGWTDKRGYRWLYVNENGKRRARREHRVIMETHLGRRLEPWEIVHHKDGNPKNNEIDNLEITDFANHTVNHSKGSRKDADARRSMQAFALLREELIAERALKAELLEALKTFVEIERGGARGAYRTDALFYAGEKANAAIAKATGEEL